MKRRALVVDDDRSMVRTLSDILTLQGWEVANAYSGEEAVAVATDEAFDVVLMDVKMPGIDGVDALKAIKARRPGVKVVLMTAYAAQDRLAEAERSGVLRILSKPVNVPALMELLASILENARPVMLVDRDPVFLRTLSDLLDLHGFETVIANDVEHARRLMMEERPLAILLHAHIGDLAARDAISAIHAEEPSAALILYSGRPHTHDEIRVAIPGDWVRAYLQKPFDLDQVTGVLNAIRRVG